MGARGRHEDPERTKPIGLVRYAEEFLATALAADDSFGKRPEFRLIPPVPVLYLVGHSIELSLKSYLLAKGVCLRDLRTKFGHDLQNALNYAEILNLSEIMTLSETDREAISLLNELYETKELEYISIGVKNFPVFGYISQTAHKLVVSVSKHVGWRPSRLPHMVYD